MSVEIESSGLEEILAQLRGLEEDMMPTLRNGVENGLKRIVAEAKTNTPVAKVGGGYLRNSIGSTALIRRDAIEANVHANAEYAVYEEMGTGQKGHDSEIGAELGATYTISRGGKPYYGKEARPYLHPAVKKNQWKIGDSLRRAIDRKLKGRG